MSLQRARTRFAPFSVVLGVLALGGAGAVSVGVPGGLSPAAEAAPLAQATVTPNHVVVRGRVFYSDREGDRNHPVPGAKIEIWDRDYQFPATGQKLDTVFTDVEGRYESHEIDNVDPDGPVGARAGTQDIFIKVFTEGEQVRLLHPLTERAFDWTSYEINEVTGQVDNVPDGTYGFPDQFIDERTEDVAAMWTFVDMSATWLLLRDTAERDPGAVTAYWSPSASDGPRFDPVERKLYFRNEDARYGDIVGQYTVYALLPDLLDPLPDVWLACMAAPPPDPRVMTDPACALLDGFAMATPLIATGSADYGSPALSTQDIDAATFGTAGWDEGDAVPGRIAGVFWDLHADDPTVEEHDRFNASYGDVWQVFDERRPTTMAEWWEGWKDLGKNGCTAIGSLFQNTIDYNTGPRITPIPDVIIDEDDSAIVDLTGYVSDDECADDTLVFTMIDAGLPEVGVVLMPTNVVSITPQADWSGRTTVTVRVSDGLIEADMTFDVIVNPINDCPVIERRIPDPPPAGYGAFIEMDLSAAASDIEDGSLALRWDVEIPPESAGLIIVGGRGTTSLSFLPDLRITGSFSVIVTLVVTDSDGCQDSQPVALYWTADGNTPPTIDFGRLRREYIEIVNTPITVDLTDIADDKEDGKKPLEWFVLNADDITAQAKKTGKQSLEFIPFDGFIGSTFVELEVQDSLAARATAGITLTWRSREDTSNLPPQILRDKLIGQITGINSQACYELTDKATDPDHNQLSLRWFAEPYDDDLLFVGAEGTRRICLRARTDFEGCLDANFIVRDPRHAEDDHDVSTCWRRINLYMPVVMRPR